MRSGRLIRVARQIGTILGEGSALAGGLSVAAWGEIRATRDVDFVTSRSLPEIEARLSGAGIAFTVRRGDILANDLPWVIAGVLDGANFQVFSPRGGRSFKTVSVSPEGEDGPSIAVVDLPDLIRLKLEAGGPKDLWDVARLVRRHPARLESATITARELGCESELMRWLERPVV